ncbi:hypothetical protein GC197_05420 [bacterium]|nr:hypothetical protein [bacterium]
MTYEEFENTLQDWLDDGRLDEADQLIAQVAPGDRDQCIELLETYRLLFAGLASIENVSPAPPAVPAIPSQTFSVWKGTSLAGIGLALALSLTIIALVPGMFVPQKPTVPPAIESLTNTDPVTGLPRDSQLPKPALRNVFDQHGLTRLATSSLEPLARSMATKTDLALRSINRVTADFNPGDFNPAGFNPIDQQLSAYPDAAPLIETLTRGLMPGTHSLTDAFSVLQESAGGPATLPTDSTTAPAAGELPDNASVS